MGCITFKKQTLIKVILILYKAYFIPIEKFPKRINNSFWSICERRHRRFI